MKTLIATLLLMASTTLFAYPFECLLSDTKTLKESEQSGHIKLLSPGLAAENIEIKITTSKLGKDFFGANTIKCINNSTIELDGDGNFTLPKIELPKQNPSLSVGMFINDLWVVKHLNNDRFIEDKDFLSILVNKKNNLTLAYVDISHVIDDHSVFLDISVSERIRLYGNDTNFIEYLFDKDLSEGDKVYVPVLEECHENKSISQCKFTVINGILTN